MSWASLLNLYARDKCVVLELYMCEEPVVKWEENRIVCYLPITLPTSRVRVKRGDQPIPTRQEILRESDLIEWQISYKENNEPAEAGEMLELGFKYNYLTEGDLIKILEYARGVSITFDKRHHIERVKTGEKFLGIYEVINRRIPIIRRNLSNECFVEVVLGHRQKAVGYQPMLYVYIPVKLVSAGLRPLIGRKAERKECVKWFPEKDDVIGIIETFSVMSEDHKNDVIELIERMLKSSRA